MEEILEKFENTLGSTRPDDDLSHKDLYKNWGRFGNQEERRNEILRQQKSNRENKLDASRGILNLIGGDEEKSVFKKQTQAQYQPTVYVPGFTNTSSFYYANVLMFSEWMIEKPEDLVTNWFVTPCPKGTRLLVVACNGMTRCYTKYGQLCYTTSTLLPGGNSNEKWRNSSVLDCFYCKDSNTLHVLDILSWNNHVMADGEMEFRRYWLENKFKEYPELGKVTKRNKMNIQLLPMTPCDPDSFQKFMMSYPPFTSSKLDGLLFYHRRGHYVAGETPLLGWLYPYMVPEVLCPGMPIHESYAAGKPQDYIDQATFIQKFEEKSNKKRTPFNRKKKKSQSTSETSMEAEDGPVECDDSVENGITEQNISEVATEQVNETTTMDAESAENIGTEAQSMENGSMHMKNGDTHAASTRSNGDTQADIIEIGEIQESNQMPIQFRSLFSYQEPTQQQATITKYYSYFN